MPSRVVELPLLQQRPTSGAAPFQSERWKDATQHALEAIPAKTPAGRDGESANWKFTKPPGDGFVMQRVDMYELTPDFEKKPYATKWEFWPVSKNFSHTTQQLMVKMRKISPERDDTLRQRLELGRRSYPGRNVFLTTQASLWANAQIPEEAKRARGGQSSAGDLRVMYTDPGTDARPGPDGDAGAGGAIEMITIFKS